MKKPDQLFRWSINMFVFLMCFQLGALLFVKSLYYQAEQKLIENKADVSFACGDFTGSESYWPVTTSSNYSSDRCTDVACPDSYWAGDFSSSERLHVVSVEKPRPTQTIDGDTTNGYYVDVDVAESSKPTRLALVSQTMMQWNLKVPKEMTQLKEVLVIAKDLVWVEGLPEGVTLTYFSPDQLCAYPVAWEEHTNSENEFRRLSVALERYTGIKPTSFQGKAVGQKLNVPMVIEQRSLATADPSGSLTLPISASTAIASQLSTGLQWLRNDQVVQAQGFQYLREGKINKIDIPKKATDALYSAGTKEFYIIRNHQFGVWKPEAKEFKPLHVPLNLQAMYWPRALTFNPNKSEVYIYNEDRGGEIYSFNVVSKKWKLFAKKVGYSLLALHFDKENSMIFGTQYKAQEIASLVKIDQAGSLVEQIPFRKPLRFSKNLWRVQILADQEDMWLKLIHPAHPGGDVYPLSQLKKL